MRDPDACAGLLGLNLILSNLIYPIIIMCCFAKTPGANFTKHLKLKIFISSIQFVWNLRKS